MQITTWSIILIALACILSLVSLGGGIFCIIRYAKTRKITPLIVGLALTFILPGVCLVLALISFIPATMVVYGPPPNISP